MEQKYIFTEPYNEVHFRFPHGCSTLLRQVPINDGTCSMQETVGQESLVTTLPLGIPLCHWKYGKYCAFKNNQEMYYDPRLLLFAVLIATMLAALLGLSP